MAFDINDTSPRDQYTASASQTVFTVSFEFLEDVDIKAYLTPNGSDPDDTADILVLTTDFTLVGAGSNGTKELTLVTGATAGDVITIIRDAGVDRDTEFLSNGDLTIASMNLELNKIITLVQQVEMNQEQRSLMFMRAAQLAGVSLELPGPEADKALVWNSGATAIENQDADTFIGGSVSAAAASAAAASSSATDAQTAQTAAENAYDSFDDRYLGEFSTAPTLDNDGNALLNGAMYWNNTTVPGKMWIYDTGAVAWGLITSANATSASSVSISDSGGHYTGTDVEAMGQEIGAEFAALPAKTETLENKTLLTPTILTPTIAKQDDLGDGGHITLEASATYEDINIDQSNNRFRVWNSADVKILEYDTVTAVLKKNTIPVYGMVILDTPIVLTTTPPTNDTWTQLDMSAAYAAAATAGAKVALINYYIIDDKTGVYVTTLGFSLRKYDETYSHIVGRVGYTSEGYDGASASQIILQGQALVKLDANSDFGYYVNSSATPDGFNMYLVGYYV